MNIFAQYDNSIFFYSQQKSSENSITLIIMFGVVLLINFAFYNYFILIIKFLQVQYMQ